jgi:hypothetical protein
MEGKPGNVTYPLVLRERFPTACAVCASPLLQLEAWRERPGGGLTVRLRCPECDARTIRDFDAQEAVRVDDALSQARLEMVALYEAVVRNNLDIEATLLAKAFELDLVGPDDFAPRRA